MNILILGAGQVGSSAAYDLSRSEANEVTVVDLNHAMLRKAHRLGFDGHIGDAMHADVLEHIGITSASVVVVTIPDPAAARAIVALIRSIAPDVYIIARARYHRYYADLQAGGAHEVIDEEQFVGARMASRLRSRLRAVERSTKPD